MAFSTGNPKEILGTNTPSITSICTHSAALRSTICVSRSRWPKSAESIEGATILFMVRILLTTNIVISRQFSTLRSGIPSPQTRVLGFGVAVRDSECRFPVARSFRGFRPERAAGQDLFRFRVSILRRIAMPLDSESSNASPMPHTHVTPTPAGAYPPAMLPVRAGTTYAPATTKPRPRRGRPG